MMSARIPQSHLDAAQVNRALRGRVAIAGAATYGCGESPGMDDMTLLVRAAHAAVADAGLTMQDIDGLATCSVNSGMWTMPVIEHLGINPTYVDGTMVGGSSFIAHLLPAIRALDAGQCKAVLICYGSAQRSAAFGRKESIAARKFMDPQPYEHPYEPVLPVTAYALAAARHMHEFGTTREQLAEVAVAARAWAQQNPEAFMRDPLSIADVLKSRTVASPLTVRDCCLVTDGAGAIVLTRADRAKDLKQPPVYVLGNATAIWNRQISCMPDLTTTAAAQSGPQAFAMAGMSAKDMDMAQLYDAFTINTILFLEDLGFCKKGEARRDICVPSDAINDRDCTFTARNKFACKNSHTIPLHGLSHRPSGRGLQSSGTTLQIQPRARISAASASAGESGCGPGISHHQSAGGCPHLMSYQTTNSPSVGTRSSVESISTRSITVSMIGYASP